MPRPPMPANRGPAMEGLPGSAQRAPEGLPARPDLVQVRELEMAKRVLEVAAPGGHSLCSSGRWGRASRCSPWCLPGFLPPEPIEAALLDSVPNF